MARRSDGVEREFQAVVHWAFVGGLPAVGAFRPVNGTVAGMPEIRNAGSVGLGQTPASAICGRRQDATQSTETRATLSLIGCNSPPDTGPASQELRAGSLTAPTPDRRYLMCLT